MAEVLAEIYGVLGYNSCVLGTTLRDRQGNIVDGHAVTLVCIEGDWIVEDPTFNVDIRNREGECVDILELRENIGTGANILTHGQTLWRKYISLDGKYRGIYDVEGECVECNGYFYYKINTDAERYKERMIEAWKSSMGYDGYKPEYETLFLYPSLLYIPKSQKYNRSYDKSLYEDIARKLKIEITVDFTIR